MGKFQSDAPHEKSEHELRAISFARELIDKFEVFDDFVANKSLDDAGIDFVFIKYVGKRKRHFRFHIQLKPHFGEAAKFRKLNPCIPVWIVHKNTKSQDAIVALLELVVEIMSREENTHTKFFKEKLQELKDLFSYVPSQKPE